MSARVAFKLQSTAIICPISGERLSSVKITFWQNNKKAYSWDVKEAKDFKELALLFAESITVSASAAARISDEAWLKANTADLHKVLSVEKNSSTAVSFAEFEKTPQGHYRSNDHHLYTYAIALDVDVATGVDALAKASEALVALRWNHLIVPTWSYTAAAPRFRVIIEASRPITTAEHRTVFAYVARQLAATGAIREADKAAFDPSRLFYNQVPCQAALDAFNTVAVPVFDFGPVDVDEALGGVVASMMNEARPMSGNTRPLAAEPDDAFNVAKKLAKQKEESDPTIADSLERACYAYSKTHSIIVNEHMLRIRKDLQKGIIQFHHSERDPNEPNETHTRLWRIARMLWIHEPTLTQESVRGFLNPSIAWTIAYASALGDVPKLDDATVTSQLERAQLSAQTWNDGAHERLEAEEAANPEICAARALWRGDGQTYAYTGPEREMVADACGVPLLELASRALVEWDGNLYVATLNGYRHVCARSSEDVANHVTRALAPLVSGIEITTERGMVRELLLRHAKVSVSEMCFMHDLQNSFGRVEWLPETKSWRLNMQGRLRTPVDPAYSEPVDRWIEVISSDPAQMRLHLAAAWELDVRCPALLHSGPADAGKTVLSLALSYPFGEVRANLQSVLTNRFATAALRSTPFVELQEGFSGDRHEANTLWSGLKQFITDPVHHTEEKGKQGAYVHAHMRVLINVNDAHQITNGVSMRSNDAGAFARRFHLQEVKDAVESRRILKEELGAGKPERWDSPTIKAVAGHIAWLNKELRAESREWAEGYRGNLGESTKLLTSGNQSATIYKMILEYMERVHGRPSNHAQNRFLLVKEGQVWINARDIDRVASDVYGEGSNPTGIRPNDLRGIVELISSSRENKAIRDYRLRDSPPVRFRQLDMERFKAYAIDRGLSEQTYAEWLAAVEAACRGSARAGVEKAN